MTDKQIRTSRDEVIIDGVNVRECECIIEDYYYQQANNLANGYKHIKNVCELGESGSEYYKLFCKDNPNCHYKQLKRKEKECEKVCKAFDIEYVIDKETGEIIYRSNKILQYKQALDEIEEIAKCNNFLIRDPFCGTGYRDLSGQILNIIKSAKDGE